MANTFEEANLVIKTISDSFTITDFSNWHSDSIKFYARIYDTSGVYTEIEYEQPIAQNYISNIKFTVTYDIIVLSWTNNNLSFDISRVEIREGQDYDTSIYRGTSTTDTISLINNQNPEGTIFWLTPCDISGLDGRRTKISVPNSWLEENGVEVYSVDLSATEFADRAADYANQNINYTAYLEYKKPYTIFVDNYLLCSVDSADWVDGAYISANEQINDTWQTHFTDSSYTNMADHIASNPSKLWYNTIPETSYYYELFWSQSKAFYSINFSTPKTAGFILEVALNYEFISTYEIGISGVPIIYLNCRFFDGADNLVYPYSQVVLKHAYEDIADAQYGSMSPYTSEYGQYLDGKVHNFKIDTGNDSSLFTGDIQRVEFYMEYTSKDVLNIPLPNLVYKTFLDATLWDATNGALVYESTYPHWMGWDIVCLSVENTIANGSAELILPFDTIDIGIGEVARYKCRLSSNNDDVGQTIDIGSTKGGSQFYSLANTDSESFSQPIFFEVTNYTGSLYLTLTNSSTLPQTINYAEDSYDGQFYIYNIPESLIDNAYFDTSVTGWSSVNMTLTWDATLKAAKMVSTADSSSIYQLYSNTPFVTGLDVPASNIEKYIIEGLHRQDAYAWGEITVCFGSTAGGADIDSYSVTVGHAGEIGEFIRFNYTVSISDYIGDIYFSIKGKCGGVGWVFYADSMQTYTTEEYNNLPPIAYSDFLKLNEFNVKITNPDNIVLTA